MMRGVWDDLCEGLFAVFGPIIAVLIAISALTLAVWGVCIIPAAIVLHIVQAVQNTNPF